MVGVILFAGCGGDDKPTRGTGRGPAAATAPAAANGAARRLPAKWYVDSDDNGIPDFVERAIGSDPTIDDCTQSGCTIPKGAASGQAERGRSTVIALDASGSMVARAGRGMTKMAAAKQAIRDYVQHTPAALDRFGLVVFGHRGNNSNAGRATSCRGVQTLAPLGGFEGGQVSRALARFKPTGWTPIAAALTEAGRSFRPGATELARILLVTDGLETCGGDPVAAAKALQRKGVHVVVDVVGLDVDAAKARRLRAVADVTGGRYVDARTTNALITRFQGFAAQAAALSSQLICLGSNRDHATICRGAMRDHATIDMNFRVNGLRRTGDEAGAREVERLIAALRSRSDRDISAGIARLDRRVAEVQREFDRIAEQAQR